MKKRFTLRILPLLAAIMILWAGCDGMFGADNEWKYELAWNEMEGGTFDTDPESTHPFSVFYPEGTEVTLTAIPIPEWEFYAWEGDITGSQNPAVIIMTEHKMITALFRPLHRLYTSVSGLGSVLVDPELEIYSVSEIISVTATPDADWAFDHWEGDASGTDNPLAISISSDSTVIAVFVFVDSVVPTIAMLGSQTVYIAAGATYEDAGATASDDIDGDITSSIIVTNPVDTSVPGTYTVSYDVFDSAGNEAITVTREVVVDGEAPVISLLGETSYTISVGDDFIEPGTTAMDDIDGDISANVWSNFGYFFTPNQPGVYVFEYNVSDRAGNQAITVTREVTAIDTTPPVITLVGSSPVLVEMGTAYIDAGATAEDFVDGDVTADIVMANPVDTGVPGIYTVGYNVSDAAGNAADEVTRRVEVVVFESMIDGPVGEDDWGIDVAEDAAGTYILAGTTYSGGIYPNDMWVVKTDSVGDPLWNVVYANPQSDAGTGVCATSDGGSVFIGYATVRIGITNYRRTWVKKFAADGLQVWAVELPGLYVASGYDIIENSAGELLITGETSAESGIGDIWVIKLDSTGSPVWEGSYGGDSGETGYAISECADGTYVIAGMTMSYGAGSVDAWILHIDDSGNQLDAWAFGGTGEDYAYSIVETASGAYVFSGTTTSSGAGGTDAWVVSVNGAGTVVSEKTYGDSSNDTAQDVIVTSNGNIIVIGTRHYSFDDRMWIISLNDALDTVWERTFFRWPDAMGSAIIETADGYLAAVGSVRYGSGDCDIWFIKF